MKRRAWWVAPLVAVFILLLATSYASPYLPPDRIWWCQLGGLLYPAIALFGLLLALYLLFKRERLAFLLVLLLALGGGHLGRVASLQTLDTSDVTPLFSVMTFNVAGYRSQFTYGEDKKWRSNDTIYNFVRQRKPDILFLQESIAVANRFLSRYYPYCYPCDNNVNILSQYPLEGGDMIFDPPGNNGGFYVDVRIKGQIIRVFNLHLQSNKVSKDLKEGILGDKEDNPKEEFLRVRKLMSNLKSGYTGRAKQARLVAAQIQASPYPVLVCGDLNDVSNSYSYRTIARGLKDVHLQIGSGVGITYRDFLPWLRIDYILLDKKLKAIELTRHQTKLSDHYALEAEIGIQKADLSQQQ